MGRRGFGRGGSLRTGEEEGGPGGGGDRGRGVVFFLYVFSF